ncbi:MAG: LCP family protein [Patescibacteria group bacterium]
MGEINVNLLKEQGTETILGKTGRSSVKFFISPLLIAVIFISSFVLGRISQSEAASFALAELDDVPIFGRVSHLINSPDRKLIGEAEDEINLLLIGMGGEGHDGPNLTDTLIVARIRPSDGTVAMVSIPRDLLVPVSGHGWRKINSVNAYGEMEKTGRGGEMTRMTAEGLLGIDIPYYVRIDFSGFRSIIDAVGGIDIHVDQAFTDYTYPTYDRGIQVVKFDEGWQHMSGETALIYARSRHGNNGEGSDFARSTRQQKVLAALKNRMMSFSTFRSPSAITNTLAALQSNIVTNLNVGEVLRLASMARDIETDNIKHEVLDNGPDSPLVDKMVDGAYVLLPKNNDWNVLRQAVSDLFETAEPLENTDPPAEEEKVDSAVEIRNGSGKEGIARDAAGKLAKYGFRIIKIGNADSFEYKNTVIFDLTYGKDEKALNKLKQALPGASVESGQSAAPHSPHSGANFLVVLGQNY